MPWDMPTAVQLVTSKASDLDVQVVVWVQMTGDLRAPMIAVRGVDVGSNAIVWSGYARATDYRASPAPDRVADLTCRALSAAWHERDTDGGNESCE